MGLVLMGNNFKLVAVLSLRLELDPCENVSLLAIKDFLSFTKRLSCYFAVLIHSIPSILSDLLVKCALLHKRKEAFLSIMPSDPKK
jgi:hypothetical protein